MKRNSLKPNLFEYREYRSYLRDWYQMAKLSRGSISFRRLAKKGGFRSSNFLMLVLQGKRNLTEESLKKVASALDLNRQEQEFFRNLVFLNQAKTVEDKNYYYHLMMQSRKLKELQPIESRQFEYYSQWYHPVVRELVTAKGFNGTPEWISQKLYPSVSPAQVAHSIELLEGLGFIKRENGTWSQANPIVSTGPELVSIVVHNYHKLLLDLTKQLMDELPMKRRDVSALTFGVSRSSLPEIREKVREFRQTLLRLAANHTEPEEVVQINIQLYPLTRDDEEVL
jgi:uncharacterized protein (TIGR02147 family)